MEHTSKKKQKENSSENIKGYLVSILSTILVIGISFFIFYFSKGYRVNIFERQITKTGVLTVQTEPSSMNLYIDGEEIGRTPRSRTLETGVHTISVWKEKYREWKKDINILEEKSTPIYPLLLLEKIEKISTWESEVSLDKYWTNKYEDFFIFLQKDSETNYSLWSYRTSPSLWDFNPNPLQILSLNGNNIELDISPNGQLGLLKIMTAEKTDSYVIELSKSNSLDKLVRIDSTELEGYSLTWAKDNKHMILESTQEIISLDTAKNVRYLILKKTPDQKYIWTTDEAGFFYLIESFPEEDASTYVYALKQSQLDGSNPKYTIEKAYFQKNTEYAEHYRNTEDQYPEFSNSPESTQALGQIESLEVNQNSKGVYIKTDTSTYWYDIPSDKYKMISPYPAELLEFSPDSKKLLFANGEYIHTFTFDKEDADHTEILGSRKIDNLLKNEVNEMNWLSNSTYISYVKGKTLYISEKDGDNEQGILDLNNTVLHSIKHTRDTLVTLEKNENTFSINQYELN